jgi:hypothetical protein
MLANPNIFKRLIRLDEPLDALCFGTPAWLEAWVVFLQFNNKLLGFPHWLLLLYDATTTEGQWFQDNGGDASLFGFTDAEPHPLNSKGSVRNSSRRPHGTRGTVCSY